MDSVNVDSVLLCRVSPFGNPRIKAHLRLPVAYRSLSRPSSALSAKAFPLRPLQLNLVAIRSVLSAILIRNCLKALRDVSSQISTRLRWARNLFRIGCYITRIRKISVKFSYFCSRPSFDDLIPTINVKTLISL